MAVTFAPKQANDTVLPITSSEREMTKKTGFAQLMSTIQKSFQPAIKMLGAIKQSNKTRQKIRDHIDQIINPRNVQAKEEGTFQEVFSTMVFLHSLRPVDAKKGFEAAPKKEVPQERQIFINVGGRMFQTTYNTVMRYKVTRLADDVEAGNNLQCRYFFGDDGKIVGVRNEFFYDRDATSFGLILNFYRTDHLHIPYAVCGPLFKEELIFWGINPHLISPCCRDTYSKYVEIQANLIRLQSHFLTGTKETEDFSQHTLPPMKDLHNQVWYVRVDNYFKYLWNQFEQPNTNSTIGRLVSKYSISMMLLSSFLLMMETGYYGRQDRNFYNKTTLDPPIGVFEQSEKAIFILITRPTDLVRMLRATEMFLLTFEVLLRFVWSPSKLKYVSYLVNWVDFVALFGSILTVILDENVEEERYLRIVRNIRVLRILRLSSYIQDLNLLWVSLSAGSKEFLGFMLLSGMCTAACGVTLYCVDNFMSFSRKGPSTVLHGFWWALQTVTSVGYGDVTPQSLLGYLVAGMTAIIGVILVALPIPVVVNNFESFYSQTKSINKNPKIDVKFDL